MKERLLRLLDGWVFDDRGLLGRLSWWLQGRKPPS